MPYGRKSGRRVSFFFTCTELVEVSKKGKDYILASLLVKRLKKEMS